MTKIRVLPENIASKIAAGEVVQRPESVVKELMENSLDAEANNISIIIKNAGKSLIQIVDDGIGMSHEDAKLAFYRHSTSKIFEISDLDRIITLGFRGEALYSISAVARVELKTKDSESDLGYQLIIEGGKLVEESSYSCERGTNISVKNLFFNVPARRNFLKSNATEFKHIHDTFQRIALSFPDKRFNFIDDDKLIFDLPPSSLEKRLQYFFGESFIESLIPVHDEYESIEIYGYLGAPHFAKKNKGIQFIYLNNRYVSNKSIAHAVYRGYEHLLEKGEYPFFLLFVKIDPAKIDVNVHPSKLEVKFDDDQMIYSSVFSAVKNALTKSDISPAIELKQNDFDIEKTRFKTPFVDQNSFFAREIYNHETIENRSTKYTSPQERFARSDNKFDVLEQTKNLIQAFTAGEIATDDKTQIPVRIVWQLHHKYILTPIKTGLMIIDQHIAHERILYEKALQSLENTLPFSQQLLFPQTIELSKPDFELIMELKDLLFKIGFDIKPFGKSAIIIQGIPQEIKNGKEREILLEILEQYREYSQTQMLSEKDNLAKSFSCKTAIKAGDPLSEKEMLSLIDNLFATEVPYVCPHGRPVFIKLSTDELDRRFGRTVK